MDRSKILDVLKKSPLASRAKAFAEQFEPCLAIRAKPVKLSELPIGASRIGGVPDVPKSFKWPSWKMVPERVKNPFSGKMVTIGVKGSRWLDFIAQIELVDIPASPTRDQLPASGRLYFFLDLRYGGNGLRGGVGGWRVIYDDSPRESLTRVAKPKTNKDETPIPAAALEFVPYCSATDWPSTVKGWKYEDSSAWVDVLNTVEPPGKDAPLHRLGGAPRGIQGGDLRDHCLDLIGGMTDEQKSQMVGGSSWPPMELKRGTWTLLLQVDHDETCDYQWLDEGRLYFLVNKDDLAKCRFDRCIGFIESH